MNSERGLAYPGHAVDRVNSHHAARYWRGRAVSASRVPDGSPVTSPSRAQRVLFTFIGVGMAVLVGFLADLLQKADRQSGPADTESHPQKVHVRLQHVLADTGALVRDGACSIMPVAGEALAGGRSRNRGPPARRQSDEHGGGGARRHGCGRRGGDARAAVPRYVLVCSRPGWPDYAVLVSGTEPGDG